MSTSRFFVAAVGVSVLVASSEADTLTAPGGTGFSWNAANVWNAGTATWNSSTPDDAVFNHSGGRTITIDAATTAGSVSVTMDSNTLTFGGTDTLTINNMLTKTGAGNLRVDRPLAGAFDASVTGGVLELRSNSPTRTGNTTVGNGATLRVSSVNTALGTGIVNLEGGSTFAFGVGGSGVTLANNVEVTGNITLANTRNSGSASFSIGTPSVSTFDLNGATRSITANATNTGDIINILSTISNGGVNLSGNATVRYGGSTGANTYTGATTLQSGFTGQLQLSKAAGNAVAGDLVVSDGTLMLRVSDNIADSSTVTMTGGTFRLQDETSTNTTDVVSALVFNGGTFTGGGGLALGGSAANGELRVNSGGVLSGGASGLNLAATVLNAGGQIRPGSSGNSNIGTLGISSASGLTWNGEASAIAQMSFNLGAGNASDTLAIINALTKGTGSFFVFDFNGFNAAAAATYDLLTFGSQAGFTVGDFSATNITFDAGYTGGFVLDSDSLQYVVTLIPEPGSLVLLMLGGLAAGRRRARSR